MLRTPWTVLRRLLIAVLALGAVGAVAACSAPERRPNTTPSPVTSTPPTPTADSGPTGTGAVPGELVGAWESAQPNSNTTLAYRFTGDGRYKYAGLLSYPSPEGIYKLTHIAEGHVQFDGHELTLRPRSSTTTREDPAFPGDNYTNRPESLAPQTYTWNVTNAVLTLTDTRGGRFVFQRAMP